MGTARSNTKRILSSTLTRREVSPEGGDWREAAACIGRWDDFIKVLSVKAAPPWVRSRAQLYEHNRKKLSAAVEICEACPVLVQCRDAMTPEDFYSDMVRGGVMPTNPSAESGLRPVGRPRREADPHDPTPCPRGHVGYWTKSSSGRRSCRECEKMRRAAAKKGERLPPALSDKCPQGHDDWKYGKDGRRCITCRRLKDRVRRRTGGSAGFAKMEA